jgi:hypothetical protein
MQASEETRAALYDAMTAYQRAGPSADPDALQAAAGAHVTASRPYIVVAAEYKASLEHPAPDLAAQQRLAEELQPLRQALSILDGARPGDGVTVGGA